MAELVKTWPNGDRLTITYEGKGDGYVYLTSDMNISTQDREMTITITAGNTSIDVVVRQKGLPTRDVIPPK